MVDGCTYCVKDVKSMCTSVEGTYCCTRRARHKGAHFACAGTDFHMIATWDNGSRVSKAMGMGFCFTGTLATLSRRAAKAAVKKAGGISYDTVNLEVDYLVLGSNGGGTLKHDAAIAKSVKCLTEKQFITLMAS